MEQFTTEELRSIYTIFGDKTHEVAMKSRHKNLDTNEQYQRYHEIYKKAYAEVIRRNNGGITK